MCKCHALICDDTFILNSSAASLTPDLVPCWVGVAGALPPSPTAAAPPTRASVLRLLPHPRGCTVRTWFLFVSTPEQILFCNWAEARWGLWGPLKGQYAQYAIPSTEGKSRIDVLSRLPSVARIRNHPSGRAASGGALAPHPPPSTRSQPESLQIFPNSILFVGEKLFKQCFLRKSVWTLAGCEWNVED